MTPTTPSMFVLLTAAEQRAALRRLVLSGQSDAAIARLVGLSANDVRRALAEHEHDSDPNDHHHDAATP
jgi:hypothetical protein